ncbi:hypothetical protein EW146_g4596 [Bondarzewia mesenterica]|uniref:Protein arginine methyltransferase NDUFAF7 n=1 Tax=Bondarzewia mesenterica TaxID=1095465 RepID=A0A4S4LU21_9AGAM|nr:hypothetical protein EW146_g4596 [Bondarzewia mesenterica]
MVDPSPSSVTPVEKNHSRYNQGVLSQRIFFPPTFNRPTRIAKANGPISFAHYMHLCLSHPTEGYYMNPSNAVFGSKGDFITSPDISQLFGELVAVWFMSRYLEAARDKAMRLVELGPGRGTLMDDMLRTLSQLRSLDKVKHVHLVETSSALRKTQEQRLRFWAEKSHLKLVWHDSIDDIPAAEDTYTMLVAHEFFDALPVHLIEKTHQGWNEVLISSAPDLAAKNVLRPSSSSSALDLPSPAVLSSPSTSHFRPVLSETSSPISTLLGSSSSRFLSLPIGSRIEVSPVGYRIARKVGKLIGGRPDSDEEGRKELGSALIIDYGGDRAYGNSFRAFKDHKIVDPFHRPGQCDLTANVDFAYLKEAMTDLLSAHFVNTYGWSRHLAPTAFDSHLPCYSATTYGPITQHDFLMRMGIGKRVEDLQSKATSEGRKTTVENDAKRLVDLTGMGKEYKVLGVVSPPPAAGHMVWPFVEAEKTS